MRKGFVPQRTIYLCFGHDEETRGRSARNVVQYLQQKNVRAEMVLDEGGEITEEKVKEIKRPVAVIGVAEKGYASFELSVQKEGGHSSMPPGETAQTVEAYIRNTIHDNRVTVKKISEAGSDPSPATSIGSAAFKRVESAIFKTIPNVMTTPFLNIAATDSRYYRQLSDGVVNFLPMTDSKGFHGINERLPLRDLQRGIHFMMTIIEEGNLETQNLPGRPALSK